MGGNPAEEDRKVRDEENTHSRAGPCDSWIIKLAPRARKRKRRKSELLRMELFQNKLGEPIASYVAEWRLRRRRKSHDTDTSHAKTATMSTTNAAACAVSDNGAAA